MMTKTSRFVVALVTVFLFAWYIGFWLWICEGVGGPWWLWCSPFILAAILWLVCSVLERRERRLAARRMDDGLLRFVQRQEDKREFSPRPVVLPRPPQPNRRYD